MALRPLSTEDPDQVREPRVAGSRWPRPRARGRDSWPSRSGRARDAYGEDWLDTRQAKIQRRPATRPSAAIRDSAGLPTLVQPTWPFEPPKHRLGSRHLTKR